MRTEKDHREHEAQDPHLPGGVIEEIERGSKQTTAVEHIRPVIVPFRGSFVCPTPTATFLILAFPGGPGPGRAWHIMSLRAVGGSPVGNTADVARFYLFEGPRPASAADADVADRYRDDTNGDTLPVAGEWGMNQLYIRYPNQFYALVTGGTAGRNYTLTGYAYDEPAIEHRHHEQTGHGFPH